MNQNKYAGEIWEGLTWLVAILLSHQLEEMPN